MTGYWTSFVLAGLIVWAVTAVPMAVALALVFYPLVGYIWLSIDSVLVMFAGIEVRDKDIDRGIHV